MSWHGKITSIFVRNGVILCNVHHVDRNDVESENVPILTSFSGELVVPKLGQKVVVGEIESGIEYIEGVLTTDGEDLPQLSEGEITFRFDGDTEITASKNDGVYNIDISAGGSVTINGIPFSDHTHAFEDSTIEDTDTGGSSESTTTKQTEKPE